jgi:hypothetical protein
MALYQKTITLGSYKLDQTDFVNLLGVLRQGINQVVLFAFTIKDGEKIYYKIGDELIKDEKIPDKIREITISLNEPIANVGDKVIYLSLGKSQSSLTIWSQDSIWVEGKCKEILDYLKRFASKWHYYYGKYGLWVNSLIFLCLLVILPSIHNIIKRLILTSVTFILLLILLGMYNLIYENTVIYFRKTRVNLFRKYLGDIIASIISGIILAAIGLLIKRYLGVE